MSLPVNQIFYSLQGEGPSVGRCATFLRLSGCNLRCSYCDTFTGFKAVSQISEVVSTLKFLFDKYKHTLLVITGGEPLLYQEEIVNLIIEDNSLRNTKFEVEIETNGTILPLSISHWINRFNVSPKLPSCGMETNLFYYPETIEKFLETNIAIFKFVIKDEQDVKDFDKMYKDIIPHDLVWFMPKAKNKKELDEVYPIVAEFVKERGYRLSSRLQVEIWDDMKGV